MLFIQWDFDTSHQEVESTFRIFNSGQSYDYGMMELYVFWDKFIKSDIASTWFPGSLVGVIAFVI